MTPEHFARQTNNIPCLGVSMDGTGVFNFVQKEVPPAVSELLEKAGMTWINTVIECVGRPSTIEQAIDIAGNKAVVMMFGLTKPDETISVKPFQIFQKELELKASYINPYTQKRALDLIDSGRLDVSSMVYDVCGLDKLEDILSKPELRANGKYIISPEK